MFGILLAGPSSSFAEACAGSQVTVVAADPFDRTNACQGAAEAIAFLRSQGLETDLPLTIRVVDELSYPCDASVLAYYRPGRPVVEVLSIHACRAVAPNGRILGLKIDDELYQSLVAHEVAHFIADQSFAAERPCLAAQEYIASTVQIGTLPQPLRETVLASRTLPGFGNDAEISSLYYALDPQAFAVKAWRHFARPGNGPAFYQRLFDGRFRRAGGGRS